MERLTIQKQKGNGNRWKTKVRKEEGNKKGGFTFWKRLGEIKETTGHYLNKYIQIEREKGEQYSLTLF